MAFRIGIANDSPASIERLRSALRALKNVELAWIVAGGDAVVAACAADPPDLVLLELENRPHDSVDDTRHIMHRSPCPILLATVDRKANLARVLDALRAGALDAVNTPHDAAHGYPELCDAIENIRRHGPLRGTASAGKETALVLIGASAGGPTAVATVLSMLTSEFPSPILLVQHVDPRFSASFVTWLDEHTSLHVREARGGDQPEAGSVLVATRSEHMILRSDGRIGFTPEPPSIYIPSIDILFSSAAEHAKGRVVAALLTGMGSDGVEGLARLRARGHFTIAQDEKTSVVYGMPKAAATAGVAAAIAGLEQIAPTLLREARRIRTGKTKDG